MIVKAEIKNGEVRRVWFERKKFDWLFGVRGWDFDCEDKSWGAMSLSRWDALKGMFRRMFR